MVRCEELKQHSSSIGSCEMSEQARHFKQDLGKDYVCSRLPPSDLFACYKVSLDSPFFFKDLPCCFSHKKPSSVKLQWTLFLSLVFHFHWCQCPSHSPGYYLPSHVGEDYVESGPLIVWSPFASMLSPPAACRSRWVSTETWQLGLKKSVSLLKIERLKPKVQH